MFIIGIKKSVLLTYLGLIFGVLGMTFAFTTMAFNAEKDYLRYSMIMLVAAGICDMFDGKVARMCKRTEFEKQFGIQIDSLADTVNFLALPVVIMLSMKMTTVFHVCVYILFIICGVSRLGVFNCNADSEKPVKYFMGLPVTSTAIIFPILGLLHGQISDAAFSWVYIIAMLITAILFITKFKVPKFKSLAFYITITVLAVILTVLLLVIR